MAIYSPSEVAQFSPAKTPEEAAAVGVSRFICNSAPYLIGYGALTGAYPAVVIGGAFAVACQTPLIPLPDPPAFYPFLGGQCSAPYRVDFKVKTVGFDIEKDDFAAPVFGGIRGVTAPPASGGAARVQGASTELGANVYGSNPQGYAIKGIRVTRLDGKADDCGNPPLVTSPSPLPPQVPPGWPTDPHLPGREIPVPYKPDGRPPSDPPFNIPIIIPVIPLKPTFAPNFNLSVPINIPVSIPISINPQINGTLNIQIDQSGNIRTPPDLLCPCESDPNAGGGATPVTTQFEVPYFACGQDKGFKSATIEAVSSSLPPTLFDALLSSSNLAEVGCEVVSKVPVAPSKLTEGNVIGVVGIASYYPLVNPDIRVVRLRIFPQRVDDFRETAIFQGTGQRLFAVMSWALEGGQGGPVVECWDMTTDMPVPASGKPRVVKILLKPGLRWELWDTGDR